jgi:hypothetical protein
MVELASTCRRSGRRPTKFTPERIEQIRNLVVQGTDREEIARALSVTIGSLQVTCSRLGISLRRPTSNGRRQNRKGQRRPTSNGKRHALSQTLEKAEGLFAASARFAIVLRHGEREHMTELALPIGTITKLALEAQFRNRRIDELLGELVTTATKQSSFQQVLDGAKAAEVVPTIGPASTSNEPGLDAV